MKRLFKILLILILIAFGILIAIPLFFQDRLAESFKTEINKELNAVVDFNTVSVSLIKSFPNINLSINDLSIVGKSPFEGETLYTAKNTALVLDVMSVIKGELPYKVKKILLEEPLINVIINEEGKANYDITESSKSDAAETSPASYSLRLDLYQISNGQIKYVDEVNKTSVLLSSLNHVGEGDLTQDIIDLHTETDIKKAIVNYQGIRYLNGQSIDSNMDFHIDLAKEEYTFDKNQLKINGLTLENEGLVKMNGSNTFIDMNFKAPSNNVKELLSLIPSLYSNEFSSIEASGVTDIRGFVKGNLTDNSYPSFNVNTTITDGRFNHPDLPSALEKLNIDFSASSSTADVSDLAIAVPTFSFAMNDNSLNGSLDIKDAYTDPLIILDCKGDVDLALLTPFLSDYDIKQLDGELHTDINLQSKYSDIENNQYSNVAFDGHIESEDIKISYASYPDVQISNSKIELNPKKITIPNTTITTKSSDIDLQGAIIDPLAYLSNSKQSKVDINVKSNRLNLNEWSSTEPATGSTTELSATMPSSSSPLENILLNYKASIKEIMYEDYNLKNFESKGTISADAVTLQNIELRLDESNIKGTGDFSNVHNYLYSDEPLRGKANLSVDKIDFNQYLSDSEQSSGSDSEIEIIKVPKDLDLSVLLSAGQIIYDKYDLRRNEASLALQDESVTLNYYRTETLGGGVSLAGNYNSKGLEKPAFDLRYDIKEMDFQQAFKKSISIQTLAPIIEYIKGTFNSDMKINGVFGKNMTPEFSDISADGFLETIEGVIEGFPALETVAQKLGVNEIRRYEIKDSRNWFEIKDGAINIEETNFSKADMNFTAGGKHYIDQRMDYTIAAEIPRSKLGENAVSSGVQSGINWIESQAKKVGADISVGDFVYFDIKIQGSIKNPSVKIIPTGAGGKSLKDTAKETAKKEIEDIKDRAIDKVTEEANKKKDEYAEKAKEEANKKIDEGVKKGKKILGDKAKEVIDDKVADELGDKAKEKIDELIDEKSKEKVDEALDKLKKVNPFKKKKKE